jgi:outer membrane translocation and assembly module TamA
VRGYERRHVGPFDAGDPIGGRSLIEGSLELRHPITETFGGAVFLDAGQVSLPSFTFPVGHLDYGAGFGVRYRSPIGPLRVYLGFPTNPPPGDPHWKVDLSIGQAF